MSAELWYERTAKSALIWLCWTKLDDDGDDDDDDDSDTIQAIAEHCGFYNQHTTVCGGTWSYDLTR